jgi:hypothetical protein
MSDEQLREVAMALKTFQESMRANLVNWAEQFKELGDTPAVRAALLENGLRADHIAAFAAFNRGELDAQQLFQRSLEILANEAQAAN